MPVLFAATAACTATLVLLGAEALPSLAALALMAVFALAPGAAILPLVGGRGDALGIGPVIGVSLGISVTLAQTMIWVGFWQPRPAALLVAGVCLPIVVLHLARALRRVGEQPRRTTPARLRVHLWEHLAPDEHRVQRCGRVLLSGPPVAALAADGAAHFRGLETCGSVTACPVCAANVRQTRAEEIDAALGRHLAGGGGAVFLTLTGVPRPGAAAGDPVGRRLDILGEPRLRAPSRSPP